MNKTSFGGLKWYKKFFFCLTDVTLLKSYNLYLVKTGQKPLLSEFILRVVRQIKAWMSMLFARTLDMEKKVESFNIVVQKAVKACVLEYISKTIILRNTSKL